LVSYLKKTLNTGIVDKVYHPAIEEFKSLLTQKINKDWESLSEDKKAEYNEIASETMQKYTHSNEYLGKELQGTYMLKLDVLSLFL
jgi:predicted ribosome quality control (RQC) complex YloA/Tae2 family protein